MPYLFIRNSKNNSGWFYYFNQSYNTFKMNENEGDAIPHAD